MRLFDTNVQQLKYEVLKEVVRLESRGELEEKLNEIPRKIIPGPKATMRCCIYCERAIVAERVKLAMGGDKDNPNVVQVIDIACDECPTARMYVTEACRGCIAHRCQSACPCGAISFQNHKAAIDHTKCKECGLCMKACPYNAITAQERPCILACKAKAISLDENSKAKIDYGKCVGCGMCVRQCPFGAIVDKSFLLDAVRLLHRSGAEQSFNVYAMVAPAIASQFADVKLGQIVSGLKKIGFCDVVEVALGADIVAQKDAKELVEKGFLTSSCCPAFVQLIHSAFPELADHISGSASPMIETAKWIKQNDKTAKVIFIGPCVAKKAEFQKKEFAGIVDCVITFEELQALLDGMGVRLEELPEEKLNNASYYGRIFGKHGGVTEAVQHVLEKSKMDFQISPTMCDGLEECRAALLKASKGKLDSNFIEGMACPGGCIGGAGCITIGHAVKNRINLEAYAKKALDQESVNSFNQVVSETLKNLAYSKK
jgi:[FeFe] hydrogenase (group B1/B3)